MTSIDTASIDTASIDDGLILFTDLQPEILSSSKTVPPGRLATVSGVALRLAQALDMPALASLIPLGPGAPQPIPQIEGATPRPRRFAGAFDDPDTSGAIGTLGRRTVALGGIATEVAVLHTALGALRNGYVVHLLVDCCGGLSERTEQAAFRQIERAGGQLSSVASFFTTLVPDLASPAGQRVLGLLRELLAP